MLLAAGRVFDPTISLGSLLTIVGFICTVWVASVKLATRLAKLESKMNVLWAAYWAGENRGRRRTDHEGFFDAGRMDGPPDNGC